MTEKFLETIYNMTDDEKREYLESKVRELPLGVVEMAVEKVRLNMPEVLIEQLLYSKNEVGYGWIVIFHKDFGLRVRNMLRDLVSYDGDLPDNTEKDWSYYYAQIVEMACGVW